MKHWQVYEGAVSSAYSLNGLDAAQLLKNCFGNLASSILSLPREIHPSAFLSFPSFLYHFHF